MLDCKDTPSASKITVNSQAHQKRKFKVKNITTAPDDIVPWKVGRIKETCYLFEEVSCLVDKESPDVITYFDFARLQPRFFRIKAPAIQRNKKTCPTSIKTYIKHCFEWGGEDFLWIVSLRFSHSKHRLCTNVIWYFFHWYINAIFCGFICLLKVGKQHKNNCGISNKEDELLLWRYQTPPWVVKVH